MKSTEEKSLETRDIVLQALSTSSLHKLTRDEILMALKEDGIDSLEGLVTKLVKTINDAEDQRSKSVSRIHFDLEPKPTPEKRVSAIVHRVPNVPFILDGIEYDPKDIRRFDGRELHFVIGSQAAPRDAVLAFENRSILSTWLQIVHLSNCAGLNIAAAPPSPASGVAPLVHGPSHPHTPSSGAATVTLPPTGGHAPPREEGPIPSRNPFDAPVEAQMFDKVSFGGNRLMLSPGLQLPVLSWIPRGQLLGWTADWDSAIRSTYSTSSLCAYYEDPGFGGTIRIVVPRMNIYDLDWLGFGSISSVRNLG